MAFIEPRLGHLPKDNAVAVQCVLYGACAGVPLGALASPYGEEAPVLYLTWKEVRPLLAYPSMDEEWQSLIAMRVLLRELYSDTPTRVHLRAAEVARAYRLHCCKAGCQSNYLCYLEWDVTLAVANAARLGVGLAAVCGDVVERVNTIVKRAYKDHTARKGWGGCRGLGHWNGRRRWCCKHGSVGF